MVAGPEISRVIEEFHVDHNQWKRRKNGHHEQTPSVQANFAKDICSLISVIEDYGNPFEEEYVDLLVLDSKEIADDAAVDTIQNAPKIGLKQFQTLPKNVLLTE